MTGSLSTEAAAAYERDGILFPFRAMSAERAADCLAKLEVMEAADGGKLSKHHNQKPHLYAPWINEIVRNKAILDAVESVIGPDILCWGSGFFSKSPGDGTYITWHQDSTYWGLSGPDVITAWVALTPSTPQSGCMQVIPATHTVDQVEHRDTFAQGNLLSRGQEIAVEVDRSLAVDVVLAPGEFSLHHVRIFHGSEPNNSTARRTGLAIRYIPTRLSQVGPERTTAFMVRGEDRFGHFAPEPMPAGEHDPAAIAFHRATVDRTFAVLYDGTDKAPVGM
jgi:ectoine hydroxylase-related dioxygenase (phytanoyl-CoA dioxygenase family)